jgi:hypothetical protein
LHPDRPADGLRHQRRIGIHVIEAVTAIASRTLEPAQFNVLDRDTEQLRHDPPSLVRHLGRRPEGCPVPLHIGDGAGRTDPISW